MYALSKILHLGHTSVIDSEETFVNKMKLKLLKHHIEKRLGALVLLLQRGITKLREVSKDKTESDKYQYTCREMAKNHF